MAAGIPYQCAAPAVAEKTVAAIVQVESAGNPLAIHDNTTGRSYKPVSSAQARALLAALLRLGHNVDAGLMQINSAHFTRFRLSPDNVFDPCVNLSVGASILRKAWSLAIDAGFRGQNALWHAVQAYNSGSLHGSPSYALRVWSAAGARHVVVSSFALNAVPFAQPWSASNTWTAH